MQSFDDIESVLSGRGAWVGPDLLERLARHPLDCVDTEYPHFVRSVDSPGAVERPSERHPVFYGCYDWHSAVHSHWCLLRQLRLFEDHPDEAAIVDHLDDRFTEANVQQEVAHFEDNESFEKPYGWAWLLRLAAELAMWEDDRATEWRTALRPLEERLVDLVESEFLTQPRPFRVGTHQNTAFALQGVIDYARVTGDTGLESAAEETALEFFETDRDYPVEYEPLGWDFVSPALMEADLLRRVLDDDAFASWLDGFLPDVTASPYDDILTPVSVADHSGDGVELHLVGLNLSNAWCLAGLAETLPDGSTAETFERSAQRHAEAGLEQAFTDDYAGAHWLSSFVLYLLTRHEGGIAPA